MTHNVSVGALIPEDVLRYYDNDDIILVVTEKLKAELEDRYPHRTKLRRTSVKDILVEVAMVQRKSK